PDQARERRRAERAAVRRLEHVHADEGERPGCRDQGHDPPPGRARELERRRADRDDRADGRAADVLAVEPRAAGSGPAHADRERDQALMSNGLAPIQSALLPVDVRKAGPNAERRYQTALAFESILVQQLTQSLGSTLESAGGAGADGDTADAA